LGLLFVVVGAFFVVAVPVIVFGYLFMAITFSRAVMRLGRRLLFGSDQNSLAQGKGNPCPSEKDLVSQGRNVGLWDRWINGL
jgi:hypothetical protein